MTKRRTVPTEAKDLKVGDVYLINDSEYTVIEVDCDSPAPRSMHIIVQLKGFHDLEHLYLEPDAIRLVLLPEAQYDLVPMRKLKVGDVILGTGDVEYKIPCKIIKVTDEEVDWRDIDDGMEGSWDRDSTDLMRRKKAEPDPNAQADVGQLIDQLLANKDQLPSNVIDILELEQHRRVFIPVEEDIIRLREDLRNWDKKGYTPDQVTHIHQCVKNMRQTIKDW
jgi:hypothetical protein